MKIAVLLTCYNRSEKTISCLDSLYDSILAYGKEVSFDIYLADDNSTDGTAKLVKLKFPGVNIINGTGNLFWAGGMRLAYSAVVKSKIEYDFYLLLNDDTQLFPHTISELFSDLKKLSNTKLILVGSTMHPSTKKFSYGGQVLKYKYGSASKIVEPNDQHPQVCDLGNANIMLITNEVVKEIGFFSDKFTHGIADYDYTLRAKKRNIPSYIASRYLGTCTDDHGYNWRSSKNYSLKERIAYLKNVKGLAYKEYLGYIKNHFPLYLPHAWLLLWIKTLFPIIWDKVKATKKV